MIVVAKKITCFVLLLSLAGALSAQNIVWTDTIIGVNIQHAHEVTVDAVGNSYVVGEFETAITLQTSSGLAVINSDGGRDGILLKYNPAGQILWYAKIGGITNDEYIYDVAVDASGNVYACGAISSSSVTFYGNGNPNISRPNAGNQDCFFAKYSSTGNLLWVITPNGTNADIATGITTDGTNVYVTGYFRSSIDFGGGAGSILPNIGGNVEDGFITSFTVGGVYNWVKRISGTQEDIPQAITHFGNFLYATGYSGNANVTFSGTPNITKTNLGNDDIWTACFNKSDGNVTWATLAGDNNDQRGTDIAANANGIYVSGFFENNLNIYTTAGAFVDTRASNGNEDICAIHYNFAGVKQNVITIGGTSDDRGSAIAVDGFGDIYIGGTFSNTVNFGSGSITSVGGNDCFLSKYRTNGTHIITKHISGNGNNQLYGVDCNGTNGAFCGYYRSGNLTIPTNPVTPSNPVINSDEYFMGYFRVCQTPTIACPANIVQNNTFGSCSASVIVPQPTILTGCAPFTFTNSFNGTSNASGTYPIGTTNVTWTATDLIGITTTCSMNITVNDAQNPTVSCPANVIQNCSPGLCSRIVNGIAPSSVNDNCPGFTITYSITGATTATGTNDASGTSFNVGTSTVTYTITDASGNTASCNFTVTINDNISPTVTCPSNLSLNTDPGTCTKIVNGIAPIASDNCAVTGISYVITGATTSSGTNDASGESFNLGTSTVTYTARDFIGNTTNCSFTVTITDNENPSITCPGTITENANPMCQFTLPDYTALAVTSDNCGVASVTQSPAAGTVVNTGITVVTLTVTDVNGNTNSCNFNVSVVINLNQTTITCGTTLLSQTTFGGGDNQNSFSCLGYSTNGEDMFYEIAVPNTNYLIAVTISNFSDVNDSNLDFLFLGNGCSGTSCIEALTFNQATQTFSNGNNSATFLATGPGTYYFVVDGQTDGIDSYDISFNCVESGITFDNSGACAGDADNDGIISYVNGDPTNLDVERCEHVTICHDLYIANLYNWEWLDSVHFNLGTCYTNITNATAGPGFYQPGSWVPTVDNPSNTILWEFNHTAPNITYGDGYQGNYDCSVGETHLYTFCFEADISSTCSSNSDLNISIYVSDDGVASSGSVIGSFDVELADQFTFSDPPPQFTSCPSAMALNNDPGTCGAIVSWTNPTATDNCLPVTINQISGPANNSLFPIGVSTVTYVVIDGANQTDTCRFTVAISDTENPTIACPANVTQNSDAGLCSAIVNGIAPTSSGDNCAVASITYTLSGATTGSGSNDASGQTFNLGITTVTYTITDASGNSSSCSFTVTIVDNENPTITCPGNVNQNSDVGLCTAIVNGIAPISSGDNCAVASLTYTLSGATTGSGTNDASGQLFNLGITTVTYTITDASGNSSSCSFTVTIVDNENPTITCPANVTQNSDAGLCTAIVNGIAPTSSGDNCAVASLTYTLSGATTGSGTNDASGQTFNLGITTVTYTITDASGNSSSCNFTVTIVDNENPTITCPGNVNQNNDLGFCSAVVNGIAPTSFSENCIGSTITYTLSSATIGSGTNDASGQTFNLGTTTVTYTITDAAGNSSSCSFTVSISDNENPTITCPNNLSIGNTNNVCGAIVNSISPVSINDNCSTILSYTTSGATVLSGNGDISGSTFNIGNTSVTYVVTDSSGNTSSCSFNIMVSDIQSPNISCPTNITVNSDPATCGAVINGISPSSVSDNCSINSISYTITGATTGSGFNSASGVFFNTGTSTVTYFADDPSGNTATCSFTVTVIDSQAPVLNCPGNQTAYLDASCSFILPDYTGLVSIVENCPFSNNIIQNYPAGTVLSGDPSNVTINFSFQDASGNSGTCSFDLAIVDTISPVITCPTNIFTCDTIVNFNPPTASDNCGVEFINQIAGPASGTAFPYGLTTITFEAIDSSGNSAICSFTVNVVVPGDASWLTPPTVCDNASPINLSNLITGDLGGTFSGAGVNAALFDPTIGAGTYDITYIAGAAGCEDTVVHAVTVLSHPTVDAGVDNEICGLSYQLNATFTNGTATWSGSAGNFSPSVNDPFAVVTVPAYGLSNFYFTVDQSGVCSVTDTVQIEFFEAPAADAGMDQNLDFDFDTYLAANLTAGNGVWSTVSNTAIINNTTDPNTYVSNLDIGANSFVWTVSNGPCPVVSDEVIIYVKDIFIPQAITPNGDGANDYFIIPGITNAEYSHLEIFNRWGQKVFEVENYQNDWDGKHQNGTYLSDDTYFYVLKVNKTLDFNGYLVIKR